MQSAQMPVTALPLDNRRIIVTRPEEQAGEIAEEIRRLGGTPVVLPMIRILPVEDTSELDRALQQLENIDAVIFTSLNAVRHTMKRAALLGIGGTAWDGKEVYAVGSRTAHVAREYGLKVDVVPAIHSGAELAASISSRPLRGKRVLFPRGNMGRDDALQAAVAAGAEVIPVVAYSTAGPEESVGRRMRQELLERASSLVIFASPSAARHCAQLFTEEEQMIVRNRLVVAAIGSTTRDAVLSVHWPVQILADEATGHGMVSAITKYIHTHSHA